MKKLSALYVNECLKIFWRKLFWIMLIVMVALTLVFSSLLMVFMRTEEVLSGISDEYYLWGEETYHRTYEAGSDTSARKWESAVAELNFPAEDFTATDLEKLEPAQRKSLAMLYAEKWYNRRMFELLDKTKAEIPKGKSGAIHLATQMACEELFYKMAPLVAAEALALPLSPAEQENLAACQQLDADLARAQENNDFALHFNSLESIIAIDPLPEIFADSKTPGAAMNLFKSISNYLAAEADTEQISVLREFNTANQLAALSAPAYRDTLYQCRTYIQARQAANREIIDEGRTVALPKNKHQADIDYRLARLRLQRHVNGTGFSRAQENTFSQSYSLINMLGSTIICILIIIFAGDSIAGEISRGSIKSLIVAPVRRYKIVLAKIAAVWTCQLLTVLPFFAASTLGMKIIFGALPLPEVIVRFGDSIHLLPYPVANLIYSLTSLLSLTVYSSLALLLSTVIRNTAAAIGITMGVQMGLPSFVAILLSQIKTSFWGKFIPFAHIGVEDRIVWGHTTSSVDSSSYAIVFNMLEEQPSTIFSVIYLLILIFFLLWMAINSFTRRDIT
ncbi:MAG: ABC transporter permease subunit [Clostridiaceae bacterium]|nr:ABC transporter permease subunit [Clostridiaceae bacterium]